MKKITSILTVAALCSSLFVQAQDEAITVKDVIGTADTECDGYTGVPVTGQLRVSDNGKYAVGSDIVMIHGAYMWTAESNTLEFLNPLTTDKNDQAIIANDVADDGTIAGSFVLKISESVKEFRPGIKPLNGEWIELPLPEYVKKTYMSYKYPNQAQMAKRISADGKVICGEISYHFVDADGSMPWLPVIWKIKDDNTIELIEFIDIDFNSNGFIPYDMSQDGSIITGVAYSKRGEDLPAIIRDGKLEYLAAPVLLWDEAGSRWIEEGFETEGGPEYFWGNGCVNCIDNDMNIYYFYSDGYGIFHSCVKNLITGEMKEFEQPVSCGTNGWILGVSELGGYGNSVVIEGTQVDISELNSVLNVSNDGKVLAGCGVAQNEIEAYAYPELIVLSDSPLAAVKKVNFNAPKVTLANNLLTIAGEYDKAEVYNVAGQLVATVNGSHLDINNFATGLYIVKVMVGDQTNSYKVMK